MVQEGIMELMKKPLDKSMKDTMFATRTNETIMETNEAVEEFAAIMSKWSLLQQLSLVHHKDVS